MEGFGIPIIEAMRNKCKILASDIDTFKELNILSKDFNVSFDSI